MAKKGKGVFSIEDMSEAIAREVVRAVRGRQDELSKLHTQNLAQGQHEAAKKVKLTMDALQGVVDDLEEQVNPGGGEDVEEGETKEGE